MSLKILKKQDKIDEYNFPYTLNPYYGCSLGCLCCYSTQTEWAKRFLEKSGLKPNEYRSKDNVAKKLRDDLETLKNLPGRSKKVQIGNGYEPYPDIEEDEKITRECLEVFTEHQDWIVHLVTKSKLILRDIEIIKQIRNFQAEITITTLTHDKDFEPNAISTQERLEVIKELSDAGIFVRTMIMPVLPGYTDITAIKTKSKQYGAKAHKSKGLNYFSIYRLEIKAGLR